MPLMNTQPVLFASSAKPLCVPDDRFLIRFPCANPRVDVAALTKMCGWTAAVSDPLTVQSVIDAPCDVASRMKLFGRVAGMKAPLDEISKWHLWTRTKEHDSKKMPFALARSVPPAIASNTLSSIVSEAQVWNSAPATLAGVLSVAMWLFRMRICAGWSSAKVDGGSLATSEIWQ